jgi:hypothetical protein
MMKAIFYQLTFSSEEMKFQFQNNTSLYPAAGRLLFFLRSEFSGIVNILRKRSISISIIPLFISNEDDVCSHLN